MVEVVDAHAVTDLGRRIPLYTLPEDSVQMAGPNPSDVALVRERVARLLRTATPDLAHNCHGWVFAAGQHWIKGQDVDAILEDNGYQRVVVPQAGDVIVYRSRVGSQVLHTGLVRSVAPGLILVESKWGAMGRYIHREEDQCYGDNFAYYHSGRQGHVLLGIDSTSGSTLPITPRPRRAG
jgi:hypothetical protein